MDIKGAKVLVTGGAGFIGSHIVDSLLEKNARVVIYDNFSTGLMDNIKHNADRIEIIRGDILNFSELSRAVEGVDIISHQAAQLEIFLSTSMPEKDLEVNTIGTLNILKAALQHGVKKVINASSACVYGQTDDATREDDNVNPNWAYGVSKLAAEKYANIYNDYEGLNVVSLRYGIVFGEREWYRRVLPIFIKRIIEGKAPVVFGDGKQVRDFIYVGDVVDFHNRCIQDDRANGQVFNVGKGIPVSICDLAEAAASLSAGNLKVIFENTKEGEFSQLIPDKKRNTAELKTMLLDMSKAKKILGWEASTELRDGMRREYDWARENLNRWNKISYTVV